jgi:hypothetical protein
MEGVYGMRFLFYIFIICLCLLPIHISALGQTYTLARGDSQLIFFDEPYWTIWIFSKLGTDHIYDAHNGEDFNGSVAYRINSTVSESLHPGEYIIVKQYPGQNGIKEVSYAQRYNYSNFMNEYLTSPFKGVDDIDINGWQPHQVLEKVQELAANSDDRLDYDTLIVEDPLTVVKSVDRDWNNIYLYGTSNLQPNTTITILWDADRLVDERDYFFNTFHTFVKEKADGTRYWETGINVSFQDLPVGKHLVSVIALNKTTTAIFNVGELYKNQTPIRNETIKYLWDGVIVTPTPEIIKVPVPYEVTVIKTVVITTQPFPKNPLGEEYNPSKVPNISNTVPIILMVMLAMGVLYQGRNRWK